MCGIVGYVGSDEAVPVLLDGLKRLEYRGYDSAGVCVANGPLTVVRSPGRIANLESRLGDHPLSGTSGIAHTRWATHGPPTEMNAHPHQDCSSQIAVVHNGIIENYGDLRRELQEHGHVFASETDTEVLVHLIEEERKKGRSLEEAVRSALSRVRGTYGMCVMDAREPNRIVTARLGSPIVLGVSDEGHFVASDASAIIGHTRRVVYLDDGEMAVIEPGRYRVLSLDNRTITKPIEELDWSAEDVQKDGHPHFMLKEMLEQPEVLLNTLRGRVDTENGVAILGGLRDVAERLRTIDRLIIVACGSAYYAGMAGEYMLEAYAGVPVEVELASEFRYRDPILTSQTAVLAVSQSGETADTLAAIREAKRKGALTLGIVNTVGSTIARETDAGVYNHAGPEIGVASTKAFVSQLTVFALLTLFLGRQRSMTSSAGRELTKALLDLPELVQRVLEKREQIEEVGRAWKDARSFFYLGRTYGAPIAFEGALKLKEISYIHAEGYAAGEMKHGPIALIDPSFPSVVIAPVDAVYEKTKSNIEELRARSGPVIAVTTEGNRDLDSLVDHVIEVPKTHEALQPVVNVLPLQLFAYAVSVAKGIDPDKPRNLAKSVTVE